VLFAQKNLFLVLVGFADEFINDFTVDKTFELILEFKLGLESDLALYRNRSYDVF